jgi:formate dehydrogenase subunit gamma
MVGRPPERILRFDVVERIAHWTTAVLVLTLVVTGTILYIPALSIAVGRRLVIEDIHLYVGVAVFVPLIVSLVGPWGRSLRRDLSSMNRITKAEWEWLRSFGARGRKAIGKFNPGQKLNTYAVAGLLTVLFVTGLMLRWGNFVSVSWRTSATFVHDWFALAIAVVIFGHILFALTHPGALRSMITGWVTRTWANRHAPGWDQPAAGGVARHRPATPGPPTAPLERKQPVR